MWFRIELHKDGTVASCEEASGSFNEGRTVHYVEAESREAAIVALLDRRARRLANRRRYESKRKAQFAAAGLCCDCRSEPPAAGKRRCAACLKKSSAQSKASYYRERRATLAEAEVELGVLENKRRGRRRMLDSIKRRFGNQWRYRKWLTLCKVADQFDRLTTDDFRDWLETEINLLDATGSPPLAEAAE